MTAPLTLTVGGVDITASVPLDSIVVKESGCRERGALECDVRDIASALTLGPKAQVQLYDANDARYVFTGYLNPNAITLLGLGRSFHLSCDDFGEILDLSLVVSDTRAAESFYDRITYLISTYGPLLPQTFTYVEALGTVAAATYENMTLRSAIEITCSLAGTTADYFLDGAGLIHAGTALLGAAPFKLRSAGTLGAGEIFCDDLSVTRDAKSIVNAYWIRGKNAAGSGWVTDAGSIAAYGRREEYADAPDADTGPKRDAVGNALLADNASPSLQGQFAVTAANGFRPGQTLTIQSAPQFDINSPTAFRLNTVERRYESGGSVRTYAGQFGGLLPRWSTSTPSPQSWPGARIAQGSLSITPFASTIRPVVIVGSLPTLPDALYPVGSTAVLTTTGKLYRNVADVWVKNLDGADLDAASVSGSKLVANTVTASQIAAGTITATEIASDTITAGKIAAGAIGASEIASNAVTAGAIAAGAVTADKMSIGARAGQSLVPNPSFEDGGASDATGWTFATSGVGGAVSIETSASYVSDGTRGLKLSADAGTNWSKGTSSLFPVSAGEQLYGQVSLKASDTATGCVYFRFEFFDGTSTSVSNVDVVSGGNVTTGVRQSLTGYATVPATATQCAISLHNYHPSVGTALVYDQLLVQHASGGVRNSDGNVLIDSSGITVTNGAITVTNSGSTVIIDGTSNMFKILTTGTLSQTAAANAGTTIVTTGQLTGLGTMSTTPAHISFVAEGNATSDYQYLGTRVLTSSGSTRYVAATSGGAVTTRGDIVVYTLSMYVGLSSSYAFATLSTTNGANSSTRPSYGRYYILKEAAL